jgi:hypothetical protein
MNNDQTQESNIKKNGRENDETNEPPKTSLINGIMSHTEDSTTTLGVKILPNMNSLTEEEYVNLFNTSFMKNTISLDLFKKMNLFKLVPGIYYCTVHCIFMFLIGVIILFVKNKLFLCMTLFILSLDAIANVVLFDCPLSALEKKYLNTSIIDTRLKMLQYSGMMYANNRSYDTQLEVIINGWTLCAAKILFLIIFDCFKIKPM